MAIFASFARYIFRTFTFKATNIILYLCSPLVALHWHRNEWPWMTLNGNFALKSGSSSASNGLALWLSEKTVRKFTELRTDCQRQKCRSHCTGETKRARGKCIANALVCQLCWTFLFYYILSCCLCHSWWTKIFNDGRTEELHWYCRWHLQFGSKVRKNYREHLYSLT